MNSWQIWWASLSKWERRLVKGTVVYLALVAGYVWWRDSPFIKYPALALGLALVGIVPELTREKRKTLLIMLLGSLAIGTVGVQYKDDQTSEREREELLESVNNKNLTAAWNFAITAREKKFKSNDTAPDPLDVSNRLASSGGGFAMKADRLAIRVALEESRLLIATEGDAPIILGWPDTPAEKLAAYHKYKDKLESISAGADPRRPLCEAVVAVLEQEAGYRALSADFAQWGEGAYAAVNAHMQNAPTPEIVAQLKPLELTIQEKLAQYPLAGFYNHLGVLAMGLGDRNLAMGCFYTGLTKDPEHIPLYESIAYGEWKVNQDSASAIKYAQQGLEICTSLPVEIEKEYQETLKNYTALAKDQPTLTAPLEAKRKTLEILHANIQAFDKDYVGKFESRLKLTYSYCSALEQEHHDTALAYAKELYDSDPADPEYEDNYGYVLMRFYKNTDDLDAAEKLFNTVVQMKNQPESMTTKLVQVHLADLALTRQQNAIHN